MNRITTPNYALPGSLSARRLNSGKKKEKITHVTLSVADIQGSRDSKKSHPDLSLRQKIELIQELKKRNGIECEAAIFGGGALEMIFVSVAGGAIGKGIYDFGKWLIGMGSSDTDAETTIVPEVDKRGEAFKEAGLALKKALDALGKYRDDDLAGIKVAERLKAIETLREEKINDPKSVALAIEDAITKINQTAPFMTSKDYKQVQLNKHSLRGLFAALEALYGKHELDLKENAFYKNFIEFLEESPKKSSEEYSEELSSEALEKNKVKITTKYPFIAEASQFHIMRMLIKNWKIPIAEYKVPNAELRTIQYRKMMYETFLETLIGNNEHDCLLKKEEEDPLFLRTPLSRVPAQFIEKAKNLRTALLNAYITEVALAKEDTAAYSQETVQKLEKILNLATEIPKELWNKAAREQKQIEIENEKRFDTFKDWACAKANISTDKARIIFNSLLQPQKEKFKEEFERFLSKTEFETEVQLNNNFNYLLNEMIVLDSNDPDKRLTLKDNEKGLFFLKCLEEILDKKITIKKHDSKGTIKDFLSPETKERLLKMTKNIIHDEMNFYETVRDQEFFTEPPKTSVPGMALRVHHKLTRVRRFDEKSGYVDVHRLKELVFQRILNSLYPTGEKGEVPCKSFLLSGPKGTGKSFLAEAIANQLGIPLLILARNSFKIDKEGNITLSLNEKEMEASQFVQKINEQAPCVLLLDEVDKYFPPREKSNITNSKKAKKQNKKDKQEQETKETKIDVGGLFRTALAQVGNPTYDRFSDKVIVIMTTNQPPTEDIDINTIGADGYSGTVEEELYKYIDEAIIREGRIDKKIFLFHKRYSEKQGETFARRFLAPYVENGRIKGAVNYAKAGKDIKDYSPAIVEKAIEETIKASKHPPTMETIVNELKRRPSLVRLYGDLKIIERIEAVLDMIEGFGKRIRGNINAKTLAMKAKGLTKEQIAKAMSKFTPKVLTEENIIQAFEKIRKENKES